MGLIFDESGVSIVSSDNSLDFNDEIKALFLSFNSQYLSNGWDIK